MGMFSIAKFNAKSLSAIFGFVEDVWPYKFHKNVTYPDFMEKCMSEVDLMEEFKLSPEFLNSNFQ